MLHFTNSFACFLATLVLIVVVRFRPLLIRTSRDGLFLRRIFAVHELVVLVIIFGQDRFSHFLRLLLGFFDSLVCSDEALLLLELRFLVTGIRPRTLHVLVGRRISSAAPFPLLIR